MRTIRSFEEAICPHIDSGEIKTPCHLYIGQEAVATGVCSELHDDDYVWGNHRSHGHYLAKGGDLAAMMAEIFCRSTGCSNGRGGSMHLIDRPHNILGTVPIVAATVPLAVGAALSIKLAQERRVSVAFLGDGATEEGHTLESINFASLYRLPVLFVIENNLYSSHMHMSERRREDDLTRIGSLHGIEARRVDGNDVETVHQNSVELLAELRAGQGPVLLECMTFRWRGHVGPSWDEDVGVLRKGELQEWLQKDPIERVAAALQELGVGNAALREVDEEISVRIASAVEQALDAPFPDKDTLMDHVFAATPGR